MKLPTLALSALGLFSIAAAQNGNDPLILNNRTGLSPVVYNTFSTSITTLLPPTGVAKADKVPVYTVLPGEETMDILPIPTTFLSEATMDILPIPTTFATDDTTMDILPIPCSFYSDGANTPPVSYAPIPTDWWRGPLIEAAAPATASFYTIDCNRHYCPPGMKTVIPMPPTIPTSKVARESPGTTLFPAVPPRSPRKDAGFIEARDTSDSKQNDALRFFFREVSKVPINARSSEDQRDFKFSDDFSSAGVELAASETATKSKTANGPAKRQTGTCWRHYCPPLVMPSHPPMTFRTVITSVEHSHVPVKSSA